MSSETLEIKKTGEMLAKIEANVSEATILIDEAYSLNEKIRNRYKKNAYGASFSNRLRTIDIKMKELKKAMIFKW